MNEYTREEEIDRFAAAQASVAELMRRHEKLVHYIVQRQWSAGWRYADVVHEGRIGLWQAILHYDPGRSSRPMRAEPSRIKSGPRWRQRRSLPAGAG